MDQFEFAALVADWVPAEGRNVVYQVDEGVYRPAQIVRVWEKKAPFLCNLVVFLDGINDKAYGGASDVLAIWATSRILGPEVGQYLPRKPGA